MPFLRTPDQHRQQAALLRKAGNELLAWHHETLAKVIEWRQAGELVRREVERICEDHRRLRQALGGS